ncbi:TPA: hypothetical protein U2D20_001245 [Streptococcus suis]|nr:hypothetical protein [Streptococcus suis]
MKKTFVTLATVAALVAAAAPAVSSALETKTTSNVTLRVGDYSAEYQVKFTQLKDAEYRLNAVNDKINVVVDGIFAQNGLIAQYEAQKATILNGNAAASAQVNRGFNADGSEGTKPGSNATETTNTQLLEIAQAQLDNAVAGLRALEAEKAGYETEKAAIIAEMTQLQAELDALSAKQDNSAAPEAPAANGAAAPAANGAAAPAGNGAAANGAAANGAAANNGKAAAKTVAAAKTETGAKTLPKTSAAK